MDSEDYVKVAVRIRPDYNSYEEKVLEIFADNCVRLNSNTPNDYVFDKVFDRHTDQEDIFNFTTPIIEGFIEGYNGTVFAYGQTGSGKTYTMFGKDSGNGLSKDFYENEDRGLIPRAMEYLFDQLEINQLEKQSYKWTLKCNFIELYMEKFYDLLEQGKQTLRLRSNGDKTVIDGATEKIVEYPSEVFQTILDGWSQRTTGQTRMNERSSRSHAIFILELDTSEVLPNGIVKKRNSRLNLVDLAGSEKQKDTQAIGTRFEEGKKINLSLLTLGKVIRAISKSSSSHIPYRDSMLTQLLKDSLGGNARTMTIVNVHSNKNCANETLSSLKFALDLKQVKNLVHVNEQIDIPNETEKRFLSEMSDIPFNRFEILNWHRELDQRLPSLEPTSQQYFQPPPVFKTLDGPRDEETIRRLREYFIRTSTQHQAYVNTVMQNAEVFASRVKKRLCYTDLNERRAMELAKQVKDLREYNSKARSKVNQFKRELNKVRSHRYDGELGMLEAQSEANIYKRY